MKITSIDAFPVKARLKEPFVISNLNVSDLYSVIVKVSTDIDVVGYGEAIPAWEVTGETQLGVIDVVHHFCEPQKSGINLIGEDLSNFDAVKNVIDKLHPHDRPQAVALASSAKAALETALLDAFGKSIGQPVYALFDGVNKPIPVTHVIGIYPVDDTLRRIETAANTGARIVKLKVGVQQVGNLTHYERDIEVIRQGRALLDDIDPTIRLVADANQGYVTAETTVTVCRQLGNHLTWLEQPTLAGDKLAFRNIRAQCDTPLMADEAVHDINDARLLLELGGIDYLNLKLMKTGGLLETLRVADLAQTHGVPCQMGSMLENQIGTAASAQAYLCHENVITTELCGLDLTTEWIGSGICVDNHQLKLSERPGMGIDICDADIQKHLISTADSRAYQQLKNGFQNETRF